MTNYNKFLFMVEFIQTYLRLKGYSYVPMECGPCRVHSSYKYQIVIPSTMQYHVFNDVNPKNYGERARTLEDQLLRTNVLQKVA